MSVNPPLLSTYHDFVNTLTPAELVFNFGQEHINVLIRKQRYTEFKTINDIVASKDDFWRETCKETFPDIYESARRKSSPSLSWYQLYRTLWRWLIVSSDHDSRYEFSNSRRSTNRGFIILNNEVIAVHKDRLIVYYDRFTYERLTKHMFYRIRKYIENANVVSLLCKNILYINWKTIMTRFLKFAKVTKFIIFGNIVYFITKHRSRKLYRCELINGLVRKTKITRVPLGAVALSIHNECLHILITRVILKLEGNELLFVKNIGVDASVYHTLKEYNFLNQIDWFKYFEYYAQLRSPSNSPQNFARWTQNIMTIVSYGVVTFVGNMYGILYVVRTADIQELMDLCSVPILTQYDFSTRPDQMLEICPILKVDVVETEGGHNLYVATPKSIHVVLLHEDIDPNLELNSSD